MQSDLIFDIGLHKGMDALWYLQKGFRVVGLEARKDLCEHAAGVCRDHIDRLTVVDKALFDRPGETVRFYVNPDKDDWGSLEKNYAEKGIGTAVEISVQTTTLADLIEAFGVPYYIKCDIEGGDAIFAQQLAGQKEKPAFVSLELSRPDDLDNLKLAGYTRFQIVNQWLNPSKQPPNPAREGVYAPAQFTHETSGLFGRELPENRWVSFEEISARYAHWRALMAADPEMTIGWLDVHAGV